MNVLARMVGLNPAKWLRDSLRMRKQILAFCSDQGQRTDGAEFVVILMPWLGTAVPWFSLVFGLFLARAGSRVTFVIDDLPFGHRRIQSSFVLLCIGYVAQAVRSRHAILRLSACCSTR